MKVTKYQVISSFWNSCSYWHTLYGDLCVRVSRNGVKIRVATLLARRCCVAANSRRTRPPLGNRQAQGWAADRLQSSSLHHATYCVVVGLAASRRSAIDAVGLRLCSFRSPTSCNGPPCHRSTEYPSFSLSNYHSESEKLLNGTGERLLRSDASVRVVWISRATLEVAWTQWRGWRGLQCRCVARAVTVSALKHETERVYVAV